MKTISATAIVALMTVSVGLAAAAPVFAQDAPARMHQQMQHPGDGPNRPGHGPRPGNDGPGRGGMLGGLLDFGRDSEQLEIALVRLAHRIDLTDAQQALLDSFKTAALTAQADFSGVIDATRPAAPTAGAPQAPRPDLIARLDQRIALEKAHVDALTAVQPSFEAFFTSLTDEQKTQLMPQRNERMGWQGPNGKGTGMHHPRQMPAAPAQLDAPASAPDTTPDAAPVNG